MRKLVREDPKLLEDVGEMRKSQGKRLAVQSPAGKSPLYLTNNLSGGQLPHVLEHWHVGFLYLEIDKINESMHKYNEAGLHILRICLKGSLLLPLNLC